MWVLHHSLALALLISAALVDRLLAWTVEERCNTCADITRAFGDGLKRTRGSNFGGGNTAWEERKLGSFATSEVRLVDIMEKLCQKAHHSKLCDSMVEEQEDFIEAWWKAQQRIASEETATSGSAAPSSPSQEQKQMLELAASDALHHKLCIARLQVCCQTLHFGDSCKACPSTCSGHGRCHGNGTRDGDGHCVCDTGYQGRDCEACRADSHFRDGAGLCSSCHRACKGCTGSGQEQCLSCAKGYTTGDKGSSHCVDVDECSTRQPCSPQREYCTNTDGAYMCRACHPACQGCGGEGPGNCRACAFGYQLSVNGKECVDVNECSADSQLCRGPHRVCRNTVGSFHCECEAGYVMDGYDCVKIATAQTQKRKAAGGKDAPGSKKAKAKRIWTKRFTREFLKYSAAIGALGLGSYLLKGRVLPVLVMAVACGAFLYWESVRLDNAFMRKKKL